MKNSKNLKVKALVDFGCTHIGIDEQWVKDKKIQTPDNMNPEDLLGYIRPFTYLFNKKKFEKLPERCKWDHEINLIEEAPRELNAKAYAMTLKEKEALNQWLDKQLKVGLIVESKS